MRLLERQVAGQLQVQRDLRAAVDVEHVTLWISRTRGTPSAAACARSRSASSSSAGSTWTTTSLPGSAVERGLDRVRGGVSLADRRARRDADHDVREVAAGRLAHAQPARALTGGLDAGDRLPRGFLRVGRRAVHQDVDVAPHQPGGREQHEHRDEERGRGVAGGCPARTRSSPTRTAPEPARSLREMQGVRPSAGLR